VSAGTVPPYVIVTDGARTVSVGVGPGRGGLTLRWTSSEAPRFAMSPTYEATIVYSPLIQPVFVNVALPDASSGAVPRKTPSDVVNVTTSPAGGETGVPFWTT